MSTHPPESWCKPSPWPTSVNGANLRLVDSGSATSDGYLNLSTDGKYITVPGFDANVGTVSVASTPSSGAGAVLRTLGRIDANGNVDTTTATNLQTGVNIRSAVSTNGTDIWSGGGSKNGAVYSAFGTTTGTQISTSIVNARNVEIYGNQLYVSSGSGSFAGISTLRLRFAHKAVARWRTLLIPSASPYGFFMAHVGNSVAGVKHCLCRRRRHWN